jgi:hypothetical protein
MITIQSDKWLTIRCVYAVTKSLCANIYSSLNRIEFRLCMLSIVWRVVDTTIRHTIQYNKMHIA